MQCWNKLYIQIRSRILDEFDLYVLSDYEDSGTFLLVSPFFINLDHEQRVRWLNEILSADTAFQGSTLTPSELVLLASDYEFKTSLQFEFVQSESA